MSSHNSMQVVKRDGSREDVSFDKVLLRIRKCADTLDVNATLIAQKTLSRIHDGVKTSELDELAAQLAISLITTHPDYGTLASNIIISNHQKNTDPSFTNTMRRLASQFHDKTGLPVSYLSASFMEATELFQAELDAAIQHDRDFLIDYFGFKTLERQKYLLRSTAGVTLERPQHMWMRVAVALWGEWATTQLKMTAAILDPAILKDTKALAFQRILETYELLSTKQFIHATPTLFNAGSERAQMSSCFVAGTPVHTMKGVKHIEDICIGDEVVTHTGAIKLVTQTHKNPLGTRQLYDIKIAGTPTITVTNNHRLMSLSSEQEGWGQSPTWNSVEYLRTGDWIALPKKTSGSAYQLDVKNILEHVSGDGDNITYRYEITEDIIIPYSCWSVIRKNKPVQFEKKGTPFNRFWQFDTEFMELMGIWYGDGCVTH